MWPIEKRMLASINDTCHASGVNIEERVSRTAISSQPLDAAASSSAAEVIEIQASERGLVEYQDWAVRHLHSSVYALQLSSHMD